MIHRGPIALDLVDIKHTLQVQRVIVGAEAMNSKPLLRGLGANGDVLHQGRHRRLIICGGVWVDDHVRDLEVAVYL